MNKFINIDLNSLIKREAFNFESYSDTFFKEFRLTPETEKEKAITEAVLYITKQGNEPRMKFIHLFKKKFKSFAKLMNEVENKTEPEKEKNDPTDIDRLIALLNDKFPDYFINEISKIVYYKKNGENLILPMETLKTKLVESRIPLSAKALENFFNSREHCLHVNTIQEWLDNLPQWMPECEDMIEKFFRIFSFKQYNDVPNELEFLKAQTLKFFVRCLAHGLDNVENFTNKNNNKQALILLSPISSGKTSFMMDYLLNPFKDIDLLMFSFDFQDKKNNRNPELVYKVFNLTDEFNGFCNAHFNISKLAIRIFKEITGRCNISYTDMGRKMIGLRRLNFILSTNQNTFIYDDTLLTRFVVFDLLNNNLNKVRFDLWDKHKDTDMFWAMMYYFYKLARKGAFDMQMTGEEQRTMETINKRYIARQSVTDYLYRHIAPGTQDAGRYYASSEILEALRDIESIPETIRNKYNTVNIGMYLSKSQAYHKKWEREKRIEKWYVNIVA